MVSPDDLRSELHRRGLSIRGAAPVLRVHWCTVRDWLSGRRRIPPQRAELIRLCLDDYDRNG